ncbi:hypothetical protein EYF80_061848 [Liparis tanakae]|uniref:Uncharacterized protein n=1 Tax=Liparis tanakae TaxID=230148 RepID=A0A4Z2EGU8_9TELE|nr:hypothetical protein EYF80_061848 [Liparis tanakae]
MIPQRRKERDLQDEKSRATSSGHGFDSLQKEKEAQRDAPRRVGIRSADAALLWEEQFILIGNSSGALSSGRRVSIPPSVLNLLDSLLHLPVAGCRQETYSVSLLSKAFRSGDTEREAEGLCRVIMPVTVSARRHREETPGGDTGRVRVPARYLRPAPGSSSPSPSCCCGATAVKQSGVRRYGRSERTKRTKRELNIKNAKQRGHVVHCVT